MTTTFDEMYQTKLQNVDLESQTKTFSVGFIKNENPDQPLIISLEQIHHLTDNNIHIFIQRGFGQSFGITDLEYSERGAELIDEISTIFQVSNLLIKYAPFNIDEIQYLKNNQILVSTIHEKSITNEMALILYARKATALGINYIKDKKGIYLFQTIIDNTLSNSAKTIAIGVITSSVIMSFTYDRNIRQTIQLNPEFLSSIYCYLGEICHPKIASNARVPWKDILGLCWDWN
jgi:hypothetical protein